MRSAIEKSLANHCEDLNASLYEYWCPSKDRQKQVWDLSEEEVGKNLEKRKH